jgi:hypothetical protein
LGASVSQHEFRTGGTTRLTIDSSGDVGIGTTSPIDLLTITGDGKYIAHHDGTNYAFRLGADSSGDGNFILYDSSGTVKVKLYGEANAANYINNGGNFGIGTASPTARLDVVGPAARPTSLAEVDTASTARFRSDSSNADSLYIAEASSGALIQVNDGATNSSTAKPLALQPFGGNVGINDTNPDRKVSIIGDSTSEGQYPLSLDATNTDYTLEFRRNGQSEWWIKQAGSSFNIHENGVGDHFRISAGGNIGIGNTSPSARLQIEEYGIDTTETSSTATTQIAIHTFAAATFRSARFTVQVTNSTDSTYHTTELLLVHDGTTANITEFGEIFTGSAAEATFDSDISSGNVRLLATPASTDTMEFKVVAHTVTV